MARASGDGHWKRQQYLNRIRAAAKDHAILLVPSYLIERRYGISHKGAAEAREMAERRASRFDGIRRIERRRQRDTLVMTLSAAEEKYPGICKSLATTGRQSHIASYYKITASRVSQINDALKSLSSLLQKRPIEVAMAAHVGKLPKTARQLFEAGMKADEDGEGNDQN